jgi:hypothetical protein
MANKRNEEIRKLFTIDGWTRRALMEKYDISDRQLRRILNVDETGHKSDISDIIKEIKTKENHKFSLYYSGEFVNSSDLLLDFEPQIGTLSPGKISWIEERLASGVNPIMKDYEIRLGGQAKESNKEATLESLQNKINVLEGTLRAIMENSSDRELINIIKKNLK